MTRTNTMSPTVEAPLSRRPGDDDTHLRGDRHETVTLPEAMRELGLTVEDVDAIGAEFDAIRADVIAERG